MKFFSEKSRSGGSFFIVVLFLLMSLSYARNATDLTFRQAVQIAMENSYRIRQLELGIERTRQNLKAERAGLKTRLSMNLQAPVIEAVSEYKWNSTLHKDEIVRRDTRLWQMDFSIRQPVILFGYPTNGYLSLNNKFYRYLQKNGSNDVTYYNRYFVEFSQPFFQPNRLRNAIKDAELNVEENELDYLSGKVDIINQVADDFYDVFQISYMQDINRNHVENLEKISQYLDKFPDNDTSHKMDKIQIQVELANARDKVLQSMSSLRMEVSRSKQRLGLDQDDSLSVSTEIHIKPIYVDLEKALDFGYNLRPRLRLLSNRRKQNEINLENTKGRNAFRVNFEVTYGIEKQDENYQYLWQNNDNSYSVALNAYLPLWDWGQRKARIEAQKISLKKTDLWIDETRESIKSQVTTAVSNLEEYQKRALSMSRNMGMAKQVAQMSINQYEQKEISLQDLLQTLNRQRETEINFMNAYIGYRRSLLNLMIYTYYDFENDTRLLDQFTENSTH